MTNMVTGIISNPLIHSVQLWESSYPQDLSEKGQPYTGVALPQLVMYRLPASELFMLIEATCESS
jgi:hypothetical protein